MRACGAGRIVSRSPREWKWSATPVVKYLYNILTKYYSSVEAETAILSLPPRGSCGFSPASARDQNLHLYSGSKRASKTSMAISKAGYVATEDHESRWRVVCG